MTHQTKHPPRPDWREPETQPSYHPFAKHDYYCRRGSHWYAFEQADYCDTCGNFYCGEHGHDCRFAQAMED